jgi:hypothetical protein
MLFPVAVDVVLRQLKPENVPVDNTWSSDVRNACISKAIYAKTAIVSKNYVIPGIQAIILVLPVVDNNPQLYRFVSQ